MCGDIQYITAPSCFKDLDTAKEGCLESWEEHAVNQVDELRWREQGQSPWECCYILQKHFWLGPSILPGKGDYLHT